MKPSTRRHRPDCGEKKNTSRGRALGLVTGSICGTLATTVRLALVLPVLAKIESRPRAETASRLRGWTKRLVA